MFKFQTCVLQVNCTVATLSCQFSLLLSNTRQSVVKPQILNRMLCSKSSFIKNQQQPWLFCQYFMEGNESSFPFLRLQRINVKNHLHWWSTIYRHDIYFHILHTDRYHCNHSTLLYLQLYGNYLSTLDPFSKIRDTQLKDMLAINTLGASFWWIVCSWQYHHNKQSYHLCATGNMDIIHQEPTSTFQRQGVLQCTSDRTARRSN